MITTICARCWHKVDLFDHLHWACPKCGYEHPAYTVNQKGELEIIVNDCDLPDDWDEWLKNNPGKCRSGKEPKKWQPSNKPK